MKRNSSIDYLKFLFSVIIVLYHYGLWFSGGYIVVEGFFMITGFLMMGQIRESGTDTTAAREGLLRLGVDAEEADSLISGMNTVCPDMVSSYVKIMTICAQYLTLSNAMSSLNPSISEAANRYIHENLEKRITIKDICEHVGCSKTTLISAFKRDFKMTVNDAITKIRLDEAKSMLITGTKSVCEIASATGFYDQSYFSKVFLREEGVTPTEYRKEKAQ